MGKYVSIQTLADRYGTYDLMEAIVRRELSYNKNVDAEDIEEIVGRLKMKLANDADREIDQFVSDFYADKESESK